MQDARVHRGPGGAQPARRMVSHPPAAGLQSSVLGLQRSAGNGAVSLMVQRLRAQTVIDADPGRAIELVRAATFAERQQFRANAGFVTRIFSDDYTGAETGEMVALLLLRVPDNVTDREAAQFEAIRLMRRMIVDKEVARRMLDNNVRVVIVPRNVGMTTLDEFSDQAGQTTFDGRSWDEVRGLGGRNTAITEENLLGTDVDTTAVPGAGNYECRYSTTTHEFAHTIHMFGLGDTDKTTIESKFNDKRALPRTAQWVDGPRQKPDGSDQDCYASMTKEEYFAQNVNAYLGTNTGADPYTGQPRNNGETWVRDNEPELHAIICRTVLQGRVTTNPRDVRARINQMTEQMQERSMQLNRMAGPRMLNDMLILPVAPPVEGETAMA